MAFKIWRKYQPAVFPLIHLTTVSVSLLFAFPLENKQLTDLLTGQHRLLLLLLLLLALEDFLILCSRLTRRLSHASRPMFVLAVRCNDYHIDI